MAIKISKKELTEENDCLKKKVDTLENKNKNLQSRIDQMLSEVKAPYHQNVGIMFTPNRLKCDKCDYICMEKDDMNKHKIDKHQKVSPIKNCKICGETFRQNYELETHMMIHGEAETFNCNICGKVFHLKWRLKKHMSVHLTSKYCHYFNNQKECPFEAIGCKFRHEQSPICKFKNCLNPLCQFKHKIEIPENDVSENFADYLDYIDNLVAEYEADNKQNINFMDGISTEIESRSFETSTPKKKRDCEECYDKSECVDCIVKRVREAHGGVTTASCTPSSGCSEVESSTCSTSR